MKALRFYAPEDVRLEEVPEPECGPDEIKLRVRNCSTGPTCWCRSPCIGDAAGAAAITSPGRWRG